MRTGYGWIIRLAGLAVLIAMVMVMTGFRQEAVSHAQQGSAGMRGVFRMGSSGVGVERRGALEVIEVKGRAEVKARGSVIWRPLAEKGTVQPDYAVRTLDKSVLTVKWHPTRSIAKLAAHTVLEVRADRLILWQGRIWLAGNQRRGENLPLTVQTPNAMMVTFRGWVSVFHQPRWLTTVSADEESAVVVAQGRAVGLKEGRMTFVYPNTPPKPSQLMTCQKVSTAVRLRCEKIVREQFPFPKQPLPESYLACLERMYWNEGGSVLKP